MSEPTNEERSKNGYIYLGNKLKQFRDYKHFTLREAAKVMGVTPPRFQELERGRPWSIHEMRLFSIFRGKSFDKILEWYEKGKKEISFSEAESKELENLLKEKIGEL